jgi:lipid-A-disaccharide synthase
MLEAVKPFDDDYKVVIAGAPAIEPEYYEQFVRGHRVKVLSGCTYQLLYNAKAALVTSGTATLETCMFNVPQVVCYNMAFKRFIGIMRRLVLKVKYVSLVNLIADREVVPELVAESFSVKNIRSELKKILQGSKREQMLDGYKEVHRRLGESDTHDLAARTMVELLEQR